MTIPLSNPKFRPLGRILAALVLLIATAGSSSPVQAAPHWVSIGPAGGVINQLVQAPSDPVRLYAAAYTSGLFRSRDGGISWQSIDRAFEGFEVRRIAVDAHDPNLVLVQARKENLTIQDFQIWRSGDGGSTWFPAAKPPKSEGIVREAYDLSFDVTTRQTAYAATFDGIFRSLDGGSTWDLWALPHLITEALAQDPESPAVRFAAARPYVGPGGGILKSTDGGATWAAAPSAGGPAVETPPTRLFFRDGALYAVWNGALYRSTDGATTWTLSAHFENLFGSDFRFSPSGTIYAATFLGVYASTDGVHWSPAEASSLEQASPGDSIAGLAALPGERVVAAGRRGIWRSTDGGTRWRAASRGIAARNVGGLIVVPNSKGTVIGAFEEGLYRTDRGENTWQHLPRQPGFEAPVLAPDPHHPGRIYALGESFEDNVGVSDDLGKTWRPVGELLLSDAQFLRVDPFHPGVLFAGTELGGGSSANGFAYRSTDGGATWTEILGFDYLLDLTFDAAHCNVVYRATYSGVDKSTDDGATWAPLPGVLSQIGTGSPSALLYEPRSRALYLGTSERGVFRSTDGGRTFRRLIGGLPRLAGGKNPAVGSLVLDAAGNVYVGLSGAGVFHLVPGHGWTAVNLGLTVVTFNGQLVADPARPGLLYAGSSGSSVLRLENP